MKTKFTLLIALFAAFGTLNAQQLPNNSLDTWTANPFQPDGWVTNDGLFHTNLGFSSRDAANKVDGAASASLTTDTVSGFTDTTGGLHNIILPSVLSLGTGHYNPGVDLHGPVYLGLPFAYRPDTLIFDYQYTPVAGSNDSAAYYIMLSKSGAPLLFDYRLLPATPTGQWAEFTLVMAAGYADSTTVPDTLSLQFISSGSVHATVGSNMHVDNVRFKYKNATGINSIAGDVALSVYPNPASNVLNVAADKNMAGNKLEVYDLTGQLVATHTLSGNTSNINIANLANGAYIYKVTDKAGISIGQSKFNVIK